ncbi:alpha/beta fold hydrolase [Gilvimarinus polysaccharolyticus]|uniref:alpha/beta fold hydrolase n=1 Tax=Gilvimarinus polysaccharolyticus TaxID=863921 RepID=UPI0006738C99|nr:alpha/beta fold hydrolase [Gilvimarinus polysaccharolyticus]
MRRGGILWLLVGTFVSVFLSACNKDGEHQPLQLLKLAPCERLAGDTPAVSGAECGYLAVPLNRAGNIANASDNNLAGEPVSDSAESIKSAENIELYIKRWPAISAAPEADPLFVIAGGPGQSATDIADMLSGAFYELRKKRDIVFVDQRGTGLSSPLNCTIDEADQLLGHSAAATDASIEKYRACAASLAPRAAYYTTPEAVADLEAVRKALGYRTINLWGGSYGTRVILAYLATHPKALRAVVMDGVAPVQLAMPYSIGGDATRALGLIAQQCLALPACAERYGDVAVAANKTAVRLRAAPVTLTIEHPLTGHPTPLLLDDSKLAGLVRFSLYDRLASRLLPAALAAAANEDYRLVASLIARLATSTNMPNLALGMHMTILCNEDAGVTPRPESELFIGVDLAAPVTRICEFWPKANIASDYYDAIHSDVPALLLSGERDPITPPYWAEQAASALTNATLLVAKGAHHGVTQEGCTSDVITDFINNTQLSEGRAECIEKIQPLLPYLSPQSNNAEVDAL